MLLLMPMIHLHSIPNISNQRSHDSSTNENRDESQQQELHDSNDHPSHVGTSDEQSTVKPSRGAGASIFGGAKPVDTMARELEIEKKLKERQMANCETTGDNEERGSSSRPSYHHRGSGERDVYRSKRSSHNDDHRDRDRRDDGRSGHGADYHHKREYSGGRQYEEDNRRRSDDGHYRRDSGGGGHDRDRHGGPSRRDHESGRTGKYNHHNHPERDNDRGNYRHRDDRSHDTNEFTNHGRSSNNNFNAEPQSRNQQRGMAKRAIPAEDDSNKLQLSNKFGMLDVDDVDNDNENEDGQSPSIDE